MPEPEAKIGVIGGTGLYDIEGMMDLETVNVITPFGPPSASIGVGKLGGVGIAFLPRHGIGHHISPTEVPSQANIFALKSMGVEYIISINSCGSFKEELRPGHLLIPDQIIDRTQKRQNTFFSDGIVAHIQFADPFCPVLSHILFEAAKETGAIVHQGGTFIAMEGPAFSTRAESRLYRAWGADIIGMTVLPEARLAREAEICYASIACVTDYDSWHETIETVTVETVLTTMRNNIEHAKETIRLAAGNIPSGRDCACASALSSAIVTDPAVIPDEMKQKLDLLIGKYVNQ
jgi:5'-methylthioadenosine phosphorylase